MTRLLTLLLCLSALAVVAGCGSSTSSSAPLSKEDYERQMQALQKDLKGTADQLTSAFESTSDLGAMAGGLRDAADLMDEASTRLHDIVSPEDVAEPHQTMVDQSAAAAETLREFADSVENTPVTELQAKLADFQQQLAAFNDLENAVDEIKTAGYDIGNQ